MCVFRCRASFDVHNALPFYFEGRMDELLCLTSRLFASSCLIKTEVLAVNSSKIIALDIGNVCVSIHYDDFFNWLAESSGSAPSARFIAACRDLECGRISEETWMDTYAGQFDGSHDNAILMDSWHAIIGEPVEGMENLLASLNELGYTFVHISDISRQDLEYFMANREISQLAAAGVYSYEVGAQKPDNAMFESFEKRYGKPVLYIDDKRCNVEIAAKRGWRSHRFVSSEGFRGELESLGLFK